MGIFGRDDRNKQPKPAPPSSAKRQPAAAQHQGAGITVIAADSVIEGTISGGGDIQIEGELRGKIDSTGAVRVAAQGKVTGSLAARTVVVAGSVHGDILAGETIELDVSSTVEGDMTAPRIRVAEGATFDGQVHMKSPPSSSPVKKEIPDPS
jgi:cytoskeletal protein CcmA (bactofilin family)